jgi:hypothetical protein
MIREFDSQNTSHSPSSARFYATYSPALPACRPSSLFPFSFQFFTRLPAVFAKEVGDFGILVFNCKIHRRSTIPVLHIDIRTFLDEQFYNLLVTSLCRLM